MKTVLSFSAVLLLLLVGCSKETETPDVQDNRLKATNYYQCWTNGVGTVNCTNGPGGNYKVQWRNCGNFVAGKGYNPGSGTMSWSGGCSGCQYFGVYGWCTNSLIEYYIGRSGGTNCGSYSTSKGSYTLYTKWVTGPSIQGNTTFRQYNCSGNSSSGINMSQHFSGWRSRGVATGNPNYCIVASEGWGGSSGSANVTVN